MGYNCHFSDCWPPTSDDHNFFVQTPFRVFLDSMEIPWSEDSIHLLWRTVDDPNFSEFYVFHQVCMLLGCVDVNGQVLT